MSQWNNGATPWDDKADRMEFLRDIAKKCETCKHDEQYDGSCCGCIRYSQWERTEEEDE